MVVSGRHLAIKGLSECDTDSKLDHIISVLVVEMVCVIILVTIVHT